MRVKGMYRLIAGLLCMMIVLSENSIYTLASTAPLQVQETEESTEQTTVTETTEDSLPESEEAEEIRSTESSGETESVEETSMPEESTVDSVESVAEPFFEETEEESAEVETITTESEEALSVEDVKVELDTDGNIARGTIENDLGGITWVIDANGKLTVSGKGEINAEIRWDDTRIMPWYEYRESINTAIIKLSNIKDVSSLLYECSQITSVDMNEFDTSNVIDMSHMFDDCSSIKHLNVSNFDTSNVTNMSGMFSGCSSLEKLDVSSFNTSNVINMSGMFSSCTSLIKLDVSGFNTSYVTNMWCMFSGCNSLIKLDISGFDTSKVTYMWSMFSDCLSLEQLDLSNFNTSNVENMSYMFYRCEALKELDVSGFDTSKVTDMSGMFSYCESIEKIDLSDFNTCNVEDMSYMFAGNSALKTLNIRSFNTCNVEDMSNMFRYCHALKGIDISGFDTSKVTNMSEMFVGCDSLTTLDVSGFNTSYVTNMWCMFYRCELLVGLDVNGFNTSNVTDMSSMFGGCELLEGVDVGGFDTSNVTDMSGMFYSCKLLEELDVSGFDTSNVTDMSCMFYGCELLEELDVSGFDTSNVTDMSGMFGWCRQFEELDVSGFDTSNVKDMSEMFEHCGDYNDLEIDVKGFNTSKVTNMSGMFSGYSATQLDVSGFDTSNVTDMSRMFSGSHNLEKLDLSNFDTSNVADMSGMFFVNDLIEINLSSFDTSNVADMENMFYWSDKLEHLDLSNFDMSLVTQADGSYGMLGKCTSLTKINAPKNVPQNIVVKLPVESGDTWYRSDECMASILPQGLPYSVVLARNEVPDASEDKIPPSDIYKNDIEINKQGVAYATFILKDNTGTVQKNRDIKYSFNGETFKTARSDGNGKIRIQTGTLKNTTGKAEKQTLTAELFLIKDDNTEEKLSYDVTLEVIVQPLSFTQKWELEAEGSLAGKLDGGVGVKAGVVNAGISLSKSEIEGSLAGKMSVENEYENGKRNLTLKQNYNAKVASKNKVGLAAEAKAVGTGLGLDAVSTNANADIGGNVGIGLKVEDYNPDDLNDLKDIGEFLWGATAQATGNVMALQAAEALGFDCYNQAEAGTSIALSAGADAGSINFGNQKIGDIASYDVNTVLSYTKSSDETDNSTKMKYKESIEVDGSLGNLELGKLKTSVLSSSQSVEDEFEAMVTGRGYPKEFSVKRSAIESGGILSETATSQSIKISYDGEELEKLCSEVPTVDAFVDDRVHYIMGDGKEKLYKALDKTSTVGEYKVETENKKSAEVELELGFSAGLGADVGIGWEGVSSCEYEQARGTYANGQTEVLATIDISEYVEAEKMDFIELVGEPIAAIADNVKDYVEDVVGKIEEGASNLWASIKGTASDAGEWFVHLVSIPSGGGGGIRSLDTFQSYTISVYSDNLNGIYTNSNPGVASVANNTLTETTASTVGDPYYVYVTDANDMEIADYTASPLTLTLNYCDEMLQAAGVDGSYAGNLAIYKYSEEYYGYTYLGGDVDAENKSVSINITSPGQYVLAVDTAAPVVTSFEVSDASRTPTILVGFDELSGFQAFSMKIDDVECISTDNWKTYYNGGVQRIIYPVTTELEEGSHTVTIYAVDGAGNAMPAPVTYEFVVDTIAPQLADVRLALGSDKLRIRVWSGDTDVQTVTAAVSQTLTDSSVVKSDCPMDVMEGYYTGLVDVDENVASVTVTVTAKDIHGNETVSEAVSRTMENLEENVENDLWVRFVDGTGENNSEYVYTGSAIKPQLEIYEGTTLLTAKKDYTVAYSKNTNAGQAVIKVTGKGNYKGTETVTFTIHPKDVSDEGVVITELAAAANGREQKPVPKITYNKKKLTNKKDKDFTVTYPDTMEGAYMNEGTYTVHIKGNGNYKGEKDVPFMIGGKPASKLKVSKIKNVEYTGSEITIPDLVVKDGNVTLTEKEHYMVSYKDNTEVGTASVIITGIAPAYVGTKTVTFKITGIPMKKAVIDKTTLPKSVVYDGSAHCSELKLTYKKDKNSKTEELVKGIHYDITYSNNCKAGKATILIKGKGRFTGTVKKTFKILPFDVKTDTDGLLTVQKGIKTVYAKGGARPEPVVCFGDTLLVKGTDYTLSYANNKAVTTENTKKKPLITVKLKGSFKGSKKTEFTIVAQSLTALDAAAPDKIYSAKKNAWKSSVVITDLDGKKLKAGTDYEKTLEYFTNEKCTLPAKKDSYPAGTTIWVRATGKGNYADSTVVTSYDIKAASVSKAKVKIADQIYTGKAITIGYDDITSIKVNREDLTAKTDYVIVPGTYKNNIKKGIATVQLKGVGNYGGTITVKYKIKQKSFLWRLLFD